MAYGLRIINDDLELLIDSDYVNPTFVQKLEFNVTPTYTEAGLEGTGSFVNLHKGYLKRQYSTPAATLNTGNYIVLWKLPDNGNIDVFYYFPTSTMVMNSTLTCEVFASTSGSSLTYTLPTAYIFATNAAGLSTLSSTGPALRLYDGSENKTFDSSFTQLVPYSFTEEYSAPAFTTPTTDSLTNPTNPIYLLPQTYTMFQLAATDSNNNPISGKVDKVLYNEVYKVHGSSMYRLYLSTYWNRTDGTQNGVAQYGTGTTGRRSILVSAADLYQTAAAGTGGGDPIYTLTRSVASVNEGSSFTITLTASGVATLPSGTLVPYNVTGIQDLDLDLTLGASTTGNFTMSSNNTASLTFAVKNDTLTEGTETFTLEVTAGTYPNISVTILDTSKSPVSYSISPQTGTVNETTNKSIVFTVTTVSVPDTTLYWAINGGSADPATDFAASSGSFALTDGTGTFTVTTTSDTTTEGSETFSVGVRTVSTSGVEQATTGTITITDTSLGATAYSFTSVENVIETQSPSSIAVFTFTNVVNKTVTFAIVAPLAGASATSGTDVTINITSMLINGSASKEVSYYPAADQITEGTEYFRITATVDGTVVATTSDISISDTSNFPLAGTVLSTYCEAYGVYPYTLFEVRADGKGGTVTEGTFLSVTCGAPVVYTITPAANNTDEDYNGLLISIGGTSITNGTYYWKINHVTTAAADFFANSGSFSIFSNSGSFSIAPYPDNITEGAQTFTVSILSGSTSGTVLKTSESITLNDTSLWPVVGTLLSASCLAYGVSPYTLRSVYADGSGGTTSSDTNNSTSCGYVPPATYTLTEAASSVDEGSSISFAVSGSNIANGTYYWNLTNTTDFSTSSGSVSVSSNSGTFSVTPTSDTTTETAAETFQARLYTDSERTNLVATSGSVTINDTSQTPGAYTPQWRTATANTTWTVPASISSVYAICMGGGAGGRGFSTGGGGGAGGIAIVPTWAVTPGETLTIVVGAGGSSNTAGGVSSITRSSNAVVTSANGGSTGAGTTGGASGGGYFGSFTGGTGGSFAGGGGAGSRSDGYGGADGEGGDGGYGIQFDIGPPISTTYNCCAGGGGGGNVAAGVGGSTVDITTSADTGIQGGGGTGALRAGTGSVAGGNATQIGSGGGGSRNSGAGGTGFRGQVWWYG